MKTAQILVVDDDDKSRTLACDFLTVNGMQTTWAVDGEEGLLCVARQRPDLILMDMRMPHLDGIETTHRLKGNPETASIPIVMLSASAMLEEKEQMRVAGCDAILTKPVALPELLATVLRILKPGSGKK